MKIEVVGVGFVGLTTGACFAEYGYDVLCVDSDNEKIKTLAAGEVPFHEPGLSDLVRRNVANGRLRFASGIEEADVYFICVGTPTTPSGEADTRSVMAAATGIGKFLRGRARFGPLVVVRSTVPVGTTDRVRLALAAEAGCDIDTAFNPEFTAEGRAIENFCRPDRVVAGTAMAGGFGTPAVLAKLRAVYAPFLKAGAPFLAMDNNSAELVKYASNAMLATRLSLVNEIARLCERAGASIDHVRAGMGADSRIGTAFTYPSLSWGGSCFGKDVAALSASGRALRVSMPVVAAAAASNEAQREWFLGRIVSRLGGTSLAGKRIALWGLAFKANTSDTRDSPAVWIQEKLLLLGAGVAIYDPAAGTAAAMSSSAPPIFLAAPEHAVFWPSAAAAAEDADAIVLATEWPEFARVDLAAVGRSMRQRILFDGRNHIERAVAEAAGFEYFGVGR